MSDTNTKDMTNKQFDPKSFFVWGALEVTEKRPEIPGGVAAIGKVYRADDNGNVIEVLSKKGPVDLVLK